MNRGKIETKEVFVKRNLRWWRENEASERVTRPPYYQAFWDRWNLDKVISPGMVIGEVGPGPFGGMLEVLGVPAQKKVFIDYVMEELRGLQFIPWPKEAEFVNSPFEKIDLPDNYCDLLVSYNALDHGWDVGKGLVECARVSKVCVLSFDCRADSVEELQRVDLDHFTKVKYRTITRLVQKRFGTLGVVKPFKKKRANGRYKTHLTAEVRIGK